MTNDEKTAYIDVELCSMSFLANMAFPNAQTRWGNLQYVHARVVSAIHNVVSHLRIPDTAEMFKD
jgi:tyrosinase